MSKKIILLVEDEESHVQLIKRGLSKSDEYEIIDVDSLKSANHYLSSQIPDLLIVDWILKDGEGIDLIQRDSMGYPVYPSIIMTSHGNEESAVEAIKSGALDYMVKSAASLRDMEHIIHRSLREWGHIQARKNAEEQLSKSLNDLVNAYEVTLEGWANALNLRDMETEQHTRRVVNYTLKIANELNLFTDEELKYIRWGSILHDIGKIGIPDAILNKPDSLTEDEWLIMKKHPEYAKKLLSSIDYLSNAIDIPYCHHEKWDGTGYPQGLKGEEIPLSARIFAIVDVWDALSSDRPYRKAWDLEKIKSYIISLSNIQFDPEIIDKIDKMKLLWN